MNMKLFCVIAVLSLAFVVVFTSWYALPGYLQGLLQEECMITKGSTAFSFWEDATNSSIYKFKVYFFNVTNADQMRMGLKPTVTQIGPYVYDLQIDHLNVEENLLEATLKYFRRKTYYFNANESVGSATDNVTILNIAIVDTAIELYGIMPDFLPMFTEAIPYILPETDDIFLTDSVQNILFDGLELHCEDSAADLFCSLLGMITVKNLRKSSDGVNFFLSLLRNETVEGPFEMYTGKSNLTKRGLLAKYENSPTIDVWSDECSKLKGSDGYFFPLPLEKDKGVDIFVPDICKSVHLSYIQDDVMDDVETQRFWTELSDFSSEKCYCSVELGEQGNPNVTCPPIGLTDIRPCTGYSLILSLPHFYLADPKLVENVTGLRPEKYLHESYAEIEPITSSPLEVCIRLQFNIQTKQIPEFYLLANLSEVVFPLGWFEMNAKVRDNVRNDIKNAVLLEFMALVTKWVLFSTGICLISIFGVLCIYYQFCSKKSKGIYSPDSEIKHNETTNENLRFWTLKYSGSKWCNL